MKRIKHILTIMLLGFSLFDSVDLCLIDFQTEKLPPISAANISQHHHHHEEMEATCCEEANIPQQPCYTIIVDDQPTLADKYMAAIWQPPKFL